MRFSPNKAQPAKNEIQNEDILRIIYYSNMAEGGENEKKTKIAASENRRRG